MLLLQRLLLVDLTDMTIRRTPPRWLSRRALSRPRTRLEQRSVDLLRSWQDSDFSVFPLTCDYANLIICLLIMNRLNIHHDVKLKINQQVSENNIMVKTATELCYKDELQNIGKPRVNIITLNLTTLINDTTDIYIPVRQQDPPILLNWTTKWERLEVNSLVIPGNVISL